MNHVDANYRGERTFLKGKKQKHRPGMSMHPTHPNRLKLNEYSVTLGGGLSSDYVICARPLTQTTNTHGRQKTNKQTLKEDKQMLT